ncbi:hypothetical protein GCM10027072_05230 [Streptomyces bullii]
MAQAVRCGRTGRALSRTGRALEQHRLGAEMAGRALSWRMPCAEMAGRALGCVCRRAEMAQAGRAEPHRPGAEAAPAGKGALQASAANSPPSGGRYAGDRDIADPNRPCRGSMGSTFRGSWGSVAPSR